MHTKATPPAYVSDHRLKLLWLCAIIPISMTTPRRIGLFVAGMVFRSMLFLTVTSTAVVIIAGNGNHAKSALIASKVYERFVPSIIETNAQQNQGAGSIPFNDPEIARIINESFPAQSLQIHAESVIDSLYAWLHQQSAQPEFTVDLTSNKQQLADALANYAVLRLASQPVCTVLPATINPFVDTCQPAGFNPAAQQANLSEQIFNSPGLLPKAVFTAEDLPKVRSGATITNRYNYAPRLFSWLVWTPWLSGGLLLLSAVALVILNRSKQYGLYKMGFEIASNGLLFMASPLIFGYVIPAVSKNLDLPTNGGGTQAVLNDALKFYTGYFDSFFLNVGFYTALFGVLVLVIAKTFKGASGYRHLAEQAGVETSNAPRQRKGKVILTADDVPVQSSETDPTTALVSRTHNKKYRTIPAEEL